MLIDSFWFRMKKSRLLSWPTYFWYSRGIVPNVFFLSSGSCMYHPDTSSIPSGLACTARMIRSLRKRCVSSSLRLTSWYVVSMSWCAPSTSVACNPPSNQTTALPSLARARASASVSPSACASLREISL